MPSSLRTLEVAVTGEARFYHLVGDRGFLGVPSTSPAAGETGIPVNRELLFGLGSPLAAQAILGG